MVIAPSAKKLEGRVCPVSNGHFHLQVTGDGATNTQQ